MLTIETLEQGIKLNMVKVNNKNTRTMPGHYHIETSPLICRTNQWTGFNMTDLRRSSVFIANFEHISRLVLVFLLLTLKILFHAGLKNCKQIFG